MEGGETEAETSTVNINNQTKKRRTAENEYDQNKKEEKDVKETDTWARTPNKFVQERRGRYAIGTRQLCDATGSKLGWSRPSSLSFKLLAPGIG